MRWVSDARPVGGWVRKTEAPLGEPVRRFHAWRNNDDTLGYRRHRTKLYVDFGGDWLDITPAGIVPPVIVLRAAITGPYGMGTYGTPRPAGIVRSSRHPMRFGVSQIGARTFCCCRLTAASIATSRPRLTPIVLPALPCQGHRRSRSPMPSASPSAMS